MNELDLEHRILETKKGNAMLCALEECRRKGTELDLECSENKQMSQNDKVILN